MSKVKLLTQAEYAAHRGVSAVAVHKAVKAGRISLIDGKIDPVVADIQWEQNSRARVRSSEVSRPAALTAPIDDADLVAQAEGRAPAPAASEAQAAAIPGKAAAYTEAVTRGVMLDNEKREMALRQQRGELVEWKDVERGGFEVGRDLRDAGEAAVNSLAADLAGATTAEQCAEILRKHHRALFEVLIKSWRAKIGAVPGDLAA